MKIKECQSCFNGFPDYYIESGECPRCAGFTDEELSDDLKEIYSEINERDYERSSDPYPDRIWPEVEMN